MSEKVDAKFSSGIDGLFVGTSIDLFDAISDWKLELSLGIRLTEIEIKHTSIAAISVALTGVSPKK